MKRVLLIIFLIFMVSCTNQQPSEDYQNNVGVQCNLHTDCKTPMDYLIQSNCPFASACIDSTCKVICPLTYHDTNPNVSKSYSYVCGEDSDCNCDERGDRTISCVCMDYTCVSVEAQ